MRRVFRVDGVVKVLGWVVLFYKVFFWSLVIICWEFFDVFVVLVVDGFKFGRELYDVIFVVFDV